MSKKEDNPLRKLQARGARPPSDNQRANRSPEKTGGLQRLARRVIDSRNARNTANLELMRQKAEHERQEALDRTRQALQKVLNLGEAGLPTPENHPHARGASDYLARLVKHNPQEALSVAQLLQEDSHAYNQWAVKKTLEAQAKREAARVTIDRLGRKPITNSVIWGSQAENGNKTPIQAIGSTSLNVLAGLVNVGQRVVLSTINLTPRDALNEIRVDNTGLYMRQPLKEIAETRRVPGKTDDLDFTIDPPAYLDKFIGVWNAIGIFGQTSGPIGRLKVLAKGSDREYGSVVVIRPGRFRKKIEDAMEKMKPVEAPPLLSPEIRPEDILHQAALAVRQMAQETEK